MSPRRRDQTGFSVQTLARRLVQALVRNTTFVQIVVIPGLLFCLDFTLRLCFGVDLVDAGADMALLAAATFMALLVEDAGYQQEHAAIAVVFMMVFLIPWIICLKISSIQTPVPISFLRPLDLGLVFSWMIGLPAFVLSSVIANVVIQEPSHTNSGR